MCVGIGITNATHFHPVIEIPILVSSQHHSPDAMVLNFCGIACMISICLCGRSAMVSITLLSTLANNGATCSPCVGQQNKGSKSDSVAPLFDDSFTPTDCPAVSICDETESSHVLVL